MKTLFEILERIIFVFLSLCSCMGMFLIGCLAGTLIDGSITTSTMWAIFLGSMILTWCSIQLFVEVRYRRLEIMADELEMQKDQQAQDLYEHLRVK